jgi:hypothetical protein
VGQIALAPRPADLPRLSRGAEWTAGRPTATHDGNLAGDGFEPILNVADVARSVARFECAGFGVSFHDDTYAFAHRDRDLTIDLTQAAGDELPGHGALYIHGQNADRLAKQWRQAGLEVDGPRDEDYGRREGSVTDPDGNVIRFGSPIR